MRYEEKDVLDLFTVPITDVLSQLDWSDRHDGKIFYSPFRNESKPSIHISLVWSWDWRRRLCPGSCETLAGLYSQGGNELSGWHKGRIGSTCLRRNALCLTPDTPKKEWTKDRSHHSPKKYSFTLLITQIHAMLSCRGYNSLSVSVDRRSWQVLHLRRITRFNRGGREVNAHPRFTDGTVLSLAVTRWLMQDENHSSSG